MTERRVVVTGMGVITSLGETVEELWDSLCEAPEAVPLTDAQRAELDRRLDDLEQEGPTGIPWDEVVRRIRRAG